MPDPVTGITAGSAVLGYMGAKEAGAKADKSTRADAAFRQKQYNDWKAIYGPIEKNLSEYYSTLTPDAITAQGLQAQQIEFQKAETQIQENLVQRGLDDSGISIAVDQNLVLQNALAKAKVRQEAPEKVREQQQDFLATGEARRKTAVSDIGSGISAQAGRDRATAASESAAFGDILGIGLQQFTGMDAETASAVSALRT